MVADTPTHTEGERERRRGERNTHTERDVSVKMPTHIEGWKLRVICGEKSIQRGTHTPVSLGEESGEGGQSQGGDDGGRGSTHTQRGTHAKEGHPHT